MSIQPIFKRDSEVNSKSIRLNLVSVKWNMTRGVKRGRIGFLKMAYETLQHRCPEWRNHEVYIINRGGQPHFAPIISRGLIDHRALYRMRPRQGSIEINSTPIAKMLAPGPNIMTFIGPDKELNAHVSALGAEVGPWFVLRKKV